MLNITSNAHTQTRPLRLSLLAGAILLAACADISNAPPERQPQAEPRVETPVAIDEVFEEKDAAKKNEVADTGNVAGSPAPLMKMRAAASGGALTAAPASEAMAVGRIAMNQAVASPSLAYDAMKTYRAQEPNTERYQHLADNPLKQVAQDPVSTFSLDVDTGSYSNVRRFINEGQLPPKDAVRVEEMVNYFPYDYPRASGGHPFGVDNELVVCPWNSSHWLLRVAVRADEVNAKAMPPANLVFLVDVSGSMDEPNKLPLLQKSLKLLVDQLRAQDRVSLVVYAGREAVVLEPTAGNQHATIANAIDQLSAGGSTAGEAGIKVAYRMARQGYIKGGINRVLLATDGDFNVGVNDTEQLKSLVEHERVSGVSLSTLGFGTGNYNEAMMEQIADIGNGNYSYVDTLQEGRKVLVDQMRSTLVTVAKDVKVQVEFNPEIVGEYRLVGYENRLLNREDFNNDKIDAGEVGAGASVTALYELTPAGAKQSVDALRYGVGSLAGNGLRRMDEANARTQQANARTQEVAFVRVRYKQPEGTTSRLLELPVAKSALKPSFAQASTDLRFATAVAGFGQLLRGGRFTADFGYDEILSIATAARGSDEFGYRAGFVDLVRTAKALDGTTTNDVTEGDAARRGVVKGEVAVQ